MAVDGVSGLGVGALKVKQVAGFEAYAGVGESDASWGESTKALRTNRLEMCVLVHAVSSLSG